MLLKLTAHIRAQIVAGYLLFHFLEFFILC
jgi:hypothetical protein